MLSAEIQEACICGRLGIGEREALCKSFPSLSEMDSLSLFLLLVHQGVLERRRNGGMSKDSDAGREKLG